MAEVTYSGKGSRGASAGSQTVQPPHQDHTKPQRPSTAAPRLEGNSQAARLGGSPGGAAGQPSTAHRMLAFLDSAERAAAKQIQPSMFPSSGASRAGAGAEAGGRGAQASTSQAQVQAQQQRERPKSAAPLRASGGPRVMAGRKGDVEPKTPRRHGRISLYNRDTEDRAPHQVPGPLILRDLDQPRVGFPRRPPEDFLRAGEGLSLQQRRQVKERLKRHPVNVEAPFIPGTGGIRLAPPAASHRRRTPRGVKPLDWSSSPASLPSRPRSLLRTYYDNGTLDFVSVRWRGNREDALVWAREVTKGPEGGGPHTRSYVSWAPEPPAELPVHTWLPIFIDGVREYDEPYRFLAIRGSEELLLKAGDTLHTFANSLVAPLKACLDGREPTVVAVVLQLMNTALSVDPRVAEQWAKHYWQFSQVLNLFLSQGGPLLVDLGYNSRAVASCRRLAEAFLTAFELAGGEVATAAVRRYSPGRDPAVTDASVARAAAKAAARAVEAGKDPGAFTPFTLF